MDAAAEARFIRQTVKIDPLQHEKEAVSSYGDSISPESVMAIRRTLVALDRNKKGYAGDRGPIVAKHYAQGHEKAMDLAAGILIDQLLEPGQPFVHLLVKFSRSGAQYYAGRVLHELETAIEHGLWGK